MNDPDPQTCPECGRSDFRLNKLGNSMIGAHRWSKHGIKVALDAGKELRREASIARQLARAKSFSQPILVLPSKDKDDPNRITEPLPISDDVTLVALPPSALGRYCAWPPCPHRLTEHNILNGRIYCSVRCRKTANRLRERNRELEQQNADLRKLLKQTQADKAENIRIAQKPIRSELRTQRHLNTNLSARIKRLKESLIETRRDASAATKASLAAIAELRILRASLGESYLRAVSQRHQE